MRTATWDGRDQSRAQGSSPLFSPVQARGGAPPPHPCSAIGDDPVAKFQWPSPDPSVVSVDEDAVSVEQHDLTRQVGQQDSPSGLSSPASVAPLELLNMKAVTSRMSATVPDIVLLMISGTEPVETP